MLNLSVAQIEELINTHGVPLYLFDENGFISNLKKLTETFRNYYPRYHVAYSYKTNYTPYICAIVKDLGGYAEVVSGMEYRIAREIGYDERQIIFNGPDKGAEGVDAVKNGSIVNIDSLDELRTLISEIAKKNEHYQIGLRVNPEIGQSFISRFGMDPDDLTEAYSIVSGTTGLEIAGLHCHISRCRNADAWKKRTEIMLELADRFFPLDPPRYIDLGSGMFGEMDPALAEQFDNPPTYEQYAEVTAGIIAEHYREVSDDKKPLLFTEPGTTLINKYMDLIGRVDGIKEVRGKAFAVLNCSTHNLGETAILKKLPVMVYEKSEHRKRLINADLVGYTCLEQDVLYSGFSGELGIGDYIRFGNVGGYSNVLKPPFIRPNCAMIAIEADGRHRLIKRAETDEDLLHTYLYQEKTINE